MVEDTLISSFHVPGKYVHMNLCPPAYREEHTHKSLRFNMIITVNVVKTIPKYITSSVCFNCSLSFSLSSTLYKVPGTSVSILCDLILFPHREHLFYFICLHFPHFVKNCQWCLRWIEFYFKWQYSSSFMRCLKILSNNV